jgi:stage II sporulation protein GA (sporulation sigma-E factor processing peptidase)
VNYFLLFGAARLTGARVPMLRLALGAAIGAAYALIVLLPGLRWASAAAVKVCALS